MSAVLPRNPFSTRFTRPEAVPFRCPEGDLLVNVRGRVAGGQGSVSSGLVSDYSLDDFSSAGQDVANASGLCRQLVRNLKSVRFGLIVGPHGSGKTTLLYSLVPYLADAFEGDGIAQVRQVQLTMPLVNDFWSRFKHARDSIHTLEVCLLGLSSGSLLIIDGVEQVTRRGLRRLLRKARRRGVFLLATSHHRVAGLSVLHQTAVDVMLIRSLVHGLLKNASPEVVEIVSQELECRDLSGLTNVRDLWFELYDIVQDHLLADSMNLRDVTDGCSIVCRHGSQRTSDAQC